MPYADGKSPVYSLNLLVTACSLFVHYFSNIKFKILYFIIFNIIFATIDNFDHSLLCIFIIFVNDRWHSRLQYFVNYSFVHPYFPWKIYLQLKPKQAQNINEPLNNVSKCYFAKKKILFHSPHSVHTSSLYRIWNNQHTECTK